HLRAGHPAPQGRAAHLPLPRRQERPTRHAHPAWGGLPVVAAATRLTQRFAACQELGLLAPQQPTHFATAASAVSGCAGVSPSTSTAADLALRLRWGDGDLALAHET